MAAVVDAELLCCSRQRACNGCDLDVGLEALEWSGVEDNPCFIAERQGFYRDARQAGLDEEWPQDRYRCRVVRTKDGFDGQCSDAGLNSRTLRDAHAVAPTDNLD